MAFAPAERRGGPSGERGAAVVWAEEAAQEEAAQEEAAQEEAAQEEAAQEEAVQEEAVQEEAAVRPPARRMPRSSSAWARAGGTVQSSPRQRSARREAQ